MSSTLLLYSLLRVPSDAELCLRSQSVEESAITNLSPSFDDESRLFERFYERANRLAASARHEQVTPMHLLHALVEETRCEAHGMLNALGVDLELLRKMTIGHVRSTHTRTQTVSHASTPSRAHSAGNIRAVPRQIDVHPALAELAREGQRHSSTWDHPLLDEDPDDDAFPMVAELPPPPPPLPSPAPRLSQPFLFDPEEMPHTPTRSNARIERPRTSPGMRRPHIPPPAPEELAKREPSSPRLPRVTQRSSKEVQQKATQDLAARLAQKKREEAQRRLHNPSATPILRKSSKSKSGVMRPAPGIPGFDRFQLNPKAFPYLAKFGRNLLAEARERRLDPVIGRDEEIRQLLDVLNKRRANNPLLIGAAGVGKTAIVEGLAWQAAQRDVPPGLEDRTIIALDLCTLLAGTQLRGSFQERMAAIKKEVLKGNGQIIIFLDELHAWIGAGSGDASSDAAGELKIALARGEFPCIGATTPKEFKRFIETDPAFERRFELIDVKPPSIDDAVLIIDGIIDRYAQHHRVQYSPETIQAAVRLSERYIPERALPDKAIGLLDRAGSLARRLHANTVHPENVAAIVSALAKVPIERLLMSDKEKFLHLDVYLSERLIGHQRVVDRVARVLRRNHAGFNSQRPIGSFLFLGPTGVGKTEMAKVLAEFLFGSRNAMVRIDMSEFGEQHAVARLVGAPPGYVGFDDGGQLTEAMRRQPHQIVLLDEIEKAHPDVLNILLQLLDDGRLTDGKGRTVDFSNALVIMTSNLGSSEASHEIRKNVIGFASNDSVSKRNEQIERAVLAAAQRALLPELWNRIEDRLVFHPLDKEDVARIAALQLADSAQRLDKERDIQLAFDDSLIDFLIERGGFDPALGARPMRTTIQTYVESSVADLILRDQLGPGDFARVLIENGEVQVLREDEENAELLD
jgi:ATP-dependent Clp protease ATP-binding subunit ClpC